MRFLMKMFVKMKELGPIVERALENLYVDPPMSLFSNIKVYAYMFVSATLQVFQPRAPLIAYSMNSDLLLTRDASHRSAPLV